MHAENVAKLIHVYCKWNGKAHETSTNTSDYSVFCVRLLKYFFYVIHFSQVRTDVDSYESNQTYTNISIMQYWENIQRGEFISQIKV